MVSNEPPQSVHVTATQTHHLGEEHKVTKPQTAKVEETKAPLNTPQQGVVSKAKAIFEHPATPAQSRPVGSNHHGKVVVPTPANNVATKVALANMGFSQLNEPEEKGAEWANLGLRDRTYILFQEKLKNTPYANKTEILEKARKAIDGSSGDQAVIKDSNGTTIDSHSAVQLFKQTIGQNSQLLKMLGDAESEAVNSF